MTQAVGENTGGAPNGSAPNGGTPNGGAPSAPAAWTDSIADQDLRDFAVTKGYNKSPLEAAVPSILQSYHNLEKLMGADKAGNTVALPNWDSEDETAVKSRNEFFDRIGRPKMPTDYDLAIPAGAKMNEALDKWSRDTFHKLGLTGKQATALSKAYQELEAAQEAEKQAADVQRFATEDGLLKKEWGAAYNDKIAKAGAVAKGLGVKPEVIDALQKQAGYSDVMKLFATLADKVGEDKLVNSDTNNAGNAMTPAEADAELKRLSRDNVWMAAWMDKTHPNHKAAVERKQFLTSQLAAGQGQGVQ